MTALPALAPAYPELWLALSAMALLMFGVFRGDGSTRSVSWLAVVALLIGVALVAMQPAGSVLTFGGLFVADGFGRFAKVLILLGSAFAIILSLGYVRTEKMERFEYPVLILLASTGMLMMVSANDLISLYLGLELQSLSLYVLAAFKRDSGRATEAGLKYFVLGALSSGMLLYGSSMIYGFAGSTNFVLIAKALAGGHASIGLVVGIGPLSLFILALAKVIGFFPWLAVLFALPWALYMHYKD